MVSRIEVNPLTTTKKRSPNWLNFSNDVHLNIKKRCHITKFRFLLNFCTILARQYTDVSSSRLLSERQYTDVSSSMTRGQARSVIVKKMSGKGSMVRLGQSMLAWLLMTSLDLPWPQQTLAHWLTLPDYADLPWPRLTASDLSWPCLPDLTCQYLTSSDLTWPCLTFPELAWPCLTSPDLARLRLTSPDFTWPPLTSPDLIPPSEPWLTLPEFTWPCLTSPVNIWPHLTLHDLHWPLQSWTTRRQCTDVLRGAWTSQDDETSVYWRPLKHTYSCLLLNYQRNVWCKYSSHTVESFS